MKLRTSENGRHFVDSDGSPFFWLADTAWNAALRGDTADWRRYLDLRRDQGFTVIQFVTGPWRGCRTPRHGRVFEQVDGAVRFDDGAFEKMDEWFSMITDRGLVPAPVLLWDNNPDDPFFAWSDQTCIETGRRMVERWAKYEPVWILGGDGDYRSRAQIERWKRIGAAVFADTDLPATMHPCGCTWVGDLFADEPWYSIVGIQSGHGSVHHDLNFLLSGPYNTRWREIRKPFVNLEPNYEMARSYKERLLFTDYHVRRAAYWSLLSAPPAGLTYGNNNIWVWAQEEQEQAEGHGSIWVAGRWEGGLEPPGIANLTTMLGVFDRLEWTELSPAGHLLADQPGWTDPNDFITCAATLDLTLIVAYLPTGGRVSFTGDLEDGKRQVQWVNPRTGDWIDSGVFGSRSIDAPSTDGPDWLLVLRAK